MSHDIDLITKVIAGIFAGVTLLVIAIFKFFWGKAKRDEPRPDSSPRPDSGMHSHAQMTGGAVHEIVVALRSIERGVADVLKQSQEQAKSDAKEGVYDAETRRLIADIASAMQALVTQIELEHVVGQRDRDDHRQDIRSIQSQLQALRTDFRDALSKLERLERRRSSRP